MHGSNQRCVRLDVLAFVAGEKNRGKKNQQQVHRKEQWERIVVCKGQGFREAYIRRVAGRTESRCHAKGLLSRSQLPRD